jgi:hypothetical protein
MIRENLGAFLEAVTGGAVSWEEGQEWLWIDQLCIDQSHTAERNHQVTMMAEIYAKACGVIVWLGVEADGSDRAVAVINSGLNVYRDDDRVRVRALLTRMYWKRLWILQEILMGRNILVLCGRKSFTWKRLEMMFRSGREAFWRPFWKTGGQEHQAALSLIEEKVSFETVSRTLSYMVETFAGLQCGDVRDKVYGLLSLVRSSRVLPVDYSQTPTAVFYNNVKTIVTDEEDLGTEETFDVGRTLRNKMNLSHISDWEILSFIEMQLESPSPPSKFNSQPLDTSGSPKWLFSSTSPRGRTPLIQAVVFGRTSNINVIKHLLDTEGDMEATDDYGRTPLSWAARDGKGEIVKILLEAGAYPKWKDKSGCTALSLAIANGHKAVAKLLEAQGPVPNGRQAVQVD